MTFNQLTSLYGTISIEEALVRLPSDIAYQESRVVDAQQSYDISINQFDLNVAKEVSRCYAEGRIEKRTAQESKAIAEANTLEGNLEVIKAKTHLNQEKLKLTYLDNLFTSQRKLASLKEAELRSGTHSI